MSVDREQEQTSSTVLQHVVGLLKARCAHLSIPPSVVSSYYRKAKDVYRRLERIEVREGYVYAVVLSTKASREGPEHSIVVKSLDGKLRKVTVGTPLEESYHHVVVSEKEMKCDCPVALYNASRADAWLEKLVQRRNLRVGYVPMLFAKHVLCKHTLAVLAKALEYGVVKITDTFVDNISLALISAYIGSGHRPNKQIEDYVLQYLSRSGSR